MQATCQEQDTRSEQNPATTVFVLLQHTMSKNMKNWLLSHSPGREKRGKEREAASGANARHENSTGLPTHSVRRPAIEDLLPHPIQERDISSEVRRLGGFIRYHAQNYYSEKSITALADDPEFNEQVSLLLGPSVPSKQLTIMLSYPRNRQTAIRFLLGWSIYQKLHISPPSQASLLPPEITACLGAMDHGTTTDDGKKRQLRGVTSDPANSWLT